MSCCSKKMVPDDPAAVGNAWMGSGLGSSGIGLQYESEDIGGIPVLRNRENTRTLEVSSEFVTTSLWKFSTIAAAITQAGTMSSSSTSPIKILLHAGLHVLAGSVTLPTYCSIIGQGMNSTVISYTAAGSTIVSGAVCSITNCWLAGNVTGANLITIAASSSCEVVGCYFTGYTGAGVLQSGASSVVSVKRSDFTNAAGTPQGVNITGASAVCHVDSCHLYSSYLGMRITAASSVYVASTEFLAHTQASIYLATTASLLTLTGCTFLQTAQGVSLNSSVAHVVHASGCTFYHSGSNNGIAGTDSLHTVHMTGCTMRRLALGNEIPSAGSRRLMNQSWLETGLDATPGLHVGNVLSVGWRDEGGSIYTCAGASNHVNVVMQTYDTANALQSTDTTVHSPSVATSLAMPNVAVGTLGYEIIGDSTPFYGLAYTVTTAGSVTTAAHSVEYYGSGGVWTALPFTAFMVDTSKGCRNKSSGSNIFPENATGNYVMMFSATLHMGTLSPAWTSQSLLSGGTKYWIRINKLSTWATNPLVSTCVTLTTTTWLNTLGNMLNFGRTREWKTMNVTWRDMFTTIATVGAYNIYAGDTIQVPQGATNKIDVGDFGGQFFFLPPDMDPCSPIKIAITYCSTSNAASQSAFTLNWTVCNLSVTSNITITDGAGSALTNQQTQAMSCSVKSTDGRIVQNAELTFTDVTSNPRSAMGSPADTWGVHWTRVASANANTMLILAFEMRYIACVGGNPLT